jgi:RND superfamily putative drug exporter
VGWLVASGAALKYIPPLTPTGSRTVIGAALGRSSPAIKAEILDAKRFHFPLSAQVVIVQHRSSGLPVQAQLTAFRHAIEIDTHKLPAFRQIGGAIPIANDGRLLKASPGHATTILTYLLISPRLNFAQSTLLADRYAHRFLSGRGDALVGVTGAYPAEYTQLQALASSLSLVQWLSIAILVLVVGLTFRSVVAPLLTLLAAGIAYVLSRRLLSLATIHLGITVPAELDPIIVVLLLGLMTDYSVFYLTSFRRRLNDGDARRVAAPLTFTEITPIVFVAGLTVGAGVSLIEIARLPLFSALAPGLAITVGVTVLVAVSFIPAALALLGKNVLWPKASPLPTGRRRLRMQKVVAHRWVAPALVMGAVALLIWVSQPIGGLSLGINLINDLSPGSQPHRAAVAAGKGFTSGVVAPAEVIVTGDGAADLTKVAHLQTLIQQQPGVAAVLGPADDLSRAPAGVFDTTVGPTARYLVVLRHDPLSSAAIAHLTHLQSVMPALLKQSDLPNAKPHYAGDTAISAEITRPARSDLVHVAFAVIIIDFILLALFLRALIAPLVLVAASVLVVASALGLTMMIFPSTLAASGWTFYAPFAVEVLLLSFGTDYNLFLTGEIWRAARRRPFREAIARGGATASRGINVAGATLGLTFAVLVVVPLRSFAEIGVAMLAGLLIDTFIVRFFVVPGVLSVLGRWAGWPGDRVHVVPRASAGGPVQVLSRDDTEGPGTSRSA